MQSPDLERLAGEFWKRFVYQLRDDVDACNEGRRYGDVLSIRFANEQDVTVVGPAGRKLRLCVCGVRPDPYIAGQQIEPGSTSTDWNRLYRQGEGGQLIGHIRQGGSSAERIPLTDAEYAVNFFLRPLVGSMAS
jgi:hypothetical protein